MYVLSFFTKKKIGDKFLYSGHNEIVAQRMQFIGNLPVKIGVVLCEILALLESRGVVVPRGTAIRFTCGVDIPISNNFSNHTI